MKRQLRSVLYLTRRREWRLLTAHTLKALGGTSWLSRMTCPIRVAGVDRRPGLRVHVEPGDLISDDLCRRGIWEPVLSRLIVERARRGGVLIDAGANQGYYSLLWAAANPQNQVYAYEPSPRVMPRLMRNVALNHLTAQIELHEIALSDRNGTSTFDLDSPSQTGWGSLVDGPGGEVTVTTRRLDTLMADLAYAAVLKIDAEGWDTRILYGAEQLLRQGRVGAVYFEQHATSMQALGIPASAAAEFLESCGYALRRIGEWDDADADVLTEWEALPR